jgi:hypothetical protein
MELLSDRRFPKVNHEASRLAAKSLRSIATTGANEILRRNISLFFPNLLSLQAATQRIAWR